MYEYYECTLVHGCVALHADCQLTFVHTMYEFTNMLIHTWATHIFYHANYTYVPIVRTTVQHVGNKK